MRDIGKNIKELRQKQNLTQDELAEKLFVTRQTVSNYETGKSRPDIEMLTRISEVLGTDPNTVLYGIPEQTDRRRKFLRLGITVAVFVLLSIVYRHLALLGMEQHRTAYDSRLRLACAFIFGPMLAFSFGWTAMEVLGVFARLSPFADPWRKRLRWLVLGTVAVYLLIVVPVFLEYTFLESTFLDFLPSWVWRILTPPAMWLMGFYPSMQGKPGVLIMGILGCALWLSICRKKVHDDIKK